MALPSPQSSGYSTNVRGFLNSKGIDNSRIGYNPSTGFTTIDGKNFTRATKNYSGAGYDTQSNLNNAFSAYNQQQKGGGGPLGAVTNATGGMAGKSGPSYSGVGYGSGNSFTNNPNAAANINAAVTQGNQHPSYGYSNPYDQQVMSAISALQQQINNQQPIDLNSIYASPQYAAAQAQQQRAAQQGVRSAQESLGGAGFGRSTALAERAQGIQNQANEYLQTQILPQLIAQQEQQRQQQLQNQLTALQQLAQQQGVYDTRHQQDRAFGLQEGQLLGAYRPEGSDQIIGQLLGLKQQAEAQGITPQQRAELSGQADQLRAQLAGMGINPALFGADVNAATAGQNMGRAGIQTQAAREFDTNMQRQAERDKVADQQYAEQFAYQKARDAISDARWKSEFDENTRQFGLKYALDKLSQENDQAYRQAQLALAKDDNARAWAAQNLDAAKFSYAKQQDAQGGGSSSSKPKANDVYSEAVTNLDGMSPAERKSFFSGEKANIIKQLGPDGYKKLYSLYFDSKGNPVQ